MENADELDVGYGHAILRAGEVLGADVEPGKSSDSIAYRSQRLGSGPEAAQQYLLDSQVVLTELRANLLERAKIHSQEGVLVAMPFPACARAEKAETMTAACAKAAKGRS